MLSLVIQVPIALGVALLLNRPLRGRALLRLIFFVPYVLSEVITAVIWLLILQPDGPSTTCCSASASAASCSLAGRPRRRRSGPCSSSSPGSTSASPSSCFLAGLQGIPHELHEAAAIDGASWWQIQRHITLPLLGPTIRIWAFLSIIGSLQLFDMVWIITGGRPGRRLQHDGDLHGRPRLPPLQFGYGSAVAVILFVISFVVALVYQRFVLRRDTAGRPDEDGQLMAAASPSSAGRQRRDLARRPRYVVALVLAAIVLVPVVYVVLGGFRTTAQIAAEPAGLPHPWVCDELPRRADRARRSGASSATAR